VVKRKTLSVVLVTGLVLTAAGIAPAAPINHILPQLDTLALLGEKADPALINEVVTYIESNPAEITNTLLPKLADTSLYERQKAVYVWALSLTKDRTTVDAIIDKHRKARTDELRGNCIHALATIGGEKAGEYLKALHDSEPDQERKFTLLSLLCQMQYEPVMPQMEEVLKQESKDGSWRPVFVFGKMGNKAVPFLLERINDKDRAIRANAINLLGLWMVPPEATKPLQERYWVETDTELRSTILGSMERMIDDLDTMKAFFEKVAAAEQDKQLADFARETLKMMDQLKSVVKAHADMKTVFSESFMQEYTKLLKSSGKEGSYETLAMSSSLTDEAKLNTLREQILQRDSEEAFFDYQKVSEIMIYNRLAANLR
jgi:hypothetical protein